MAVVNSAFTEWYTGLKGGPLKNTPKEPIDLRCDLDVPIMSSVLCFKEPAKRMSLKPQEQEGRALQPSEVLPKEIGILVTYKVSLFALAIRMWSLGPKKRRAREQEGGGDQAPLLDFGHLKCQSCELSVFVPSHAKHKARSRRTVPSYAESILLLPFPPREQWTLQGIQLRPPVTKRP